MKDPARVNKFKAAWKKVVTQIGGDAPAKAAYGKITAVFTERLGPINKQVSNDYILTLALTRSQLLSF